MILPGATLTFNTGAPEIMVLAGQCSVQLKGENIAQNYGAGQSFSVPGDSAFDITVTDTPALRLPLRLSATPGQTRDGKQYKQYNKVGSPRQEVSSPHGWSQPIKTGGSASTVSGRSRP